MNDFYVQIMGHEQGPYEGHQLHDLVRAGTIREHTLIRQGDGDWFPAKEVPGLYSDKDWTTTMILAILFPGIDRIYIGQAGLGILKFLTGGGCGVWWVIDIILLAQNKLYDDQGLPLRK